jgi:hypothetical protein
MFGFGANPGQFFGPSDMLYAFKNIECSVAGGTAVVSVNKYRNANNASPAAGGCQDAIIIKDSLRQVASDAWSRAGGAKAYMDVFTGKGSPWAIGSVLETFAFYSDAFIKTFGKVAPGTPQRKCADLLADKKLSWGQTLQAICDEYIGLDCNGFVGNWLRVVAPEFKLTPDDRADNVRRQAKAIRTRIEDIEYWDVMCYTKNEHIAAIQERASSPSRFWVCQSAGGGPRINEFGLLRTGSSIFKLAAPTAQDIGYDFYVVSLW